MRKRIAPCLSRAGCLWPYQGGVNAQGVPTYSVKQFWQLISLSRCALCSCDMCPPTAIVETAHSRFAFYTHICGKSHATQPSTTDRKAVQFSAHQG